MNGWPYCNRHGNEDKRSRGDNRFRNNSLWLCFPVKCHAVVAGYYVDDDDDVLLRA